MQSYDLPILSEEGGMPNLFVSEKGKFFLSWIEFLNDSTDALYYSELEGDEWSVPRTIEIGSDWFVNWADFPSIAAYRDHNNFLVAHWLRMSGSGTYSYDVQISQSENGGRHWRSAFTPHRDSIQAEHGFVSLVPLPQWKMFAVWLDGRNMASDASGHNHHGHSGSMTLRSAIFDTENRLGDERVLDTMVCECCQTDAVMTRKGIAVVYRDRSNEEVRDISIVRLANGKWSEPRTIFDDNWKIAGCPVNGPAMDAIGDTLAIAWYTAANEKPQVKAVFSNDAGETFSQPVRIDEGNPLGRVDICLLSGNQAIVSWMEQTETSAQIKTRFITQNGEKGPSQLIAHSAANRASGFPVMEYTHGKVVMAWTIADSTGSSVRSVMLKYVD